MGPAPCDWHRGKPDVCVEDSEYAVRVGTVVGRYCGPHLLVYLEATGEQTIVWPTETSDGMILGSEIDEP